MEAFAGSLDFISASCHVGQELEVMFDADNTDADTHTTEKYIIFSIRRPRSYTMSSAPHLCRLDGVYVEAVPESLLRLRATDDRCLLEATNIRWEKGELAAVPCLCGRGMDSGSMVTRQRLTTVGQPAQHGRATDDGRSSTRKKCRRSPTHPIKREIVPVRYAKGKIKQ